MNQIPMPLRLAGAFLLCCLAAAGSARADAQPYLTPGLPDLTRLLAPPPAPDSRETKAELSELLALQKRRTPAEEALARADAKRTPLRFADVLGPDFAKDALPLTDAFFKRVLRDVNQALAPVKKHWDRPRPYVQSRAVRPCLIKPLNASYPSGHSAFGHLAAILLAQAVPEKAVELFERGELFARQRLIGGVHFPSDVEAGKLCAAVIAQCLFQNQRFQEDFQKVRAEIRTALGLP